MHSADPQPEYKFEYWRATRQANGPDGYPPHLRLYKLGWSCEWKGELVQRVAIFDVLENTATIRTVR